MADITITATGDVSALLAALDRAARAGAGMSDDIERAAGRMGTGVVGHAERASGGLRGALGSGVLGAIGGAFAGVGMAAASAIGGVVVGGFSKAKGAIIDFNSTLENANIGFTTMLGSGTKSKAFLDQLQTFAANTPFDFKGLVGNSQTMLGMGVNAKDIIPSLTALGDSVASVGGDGQMLDNTISAFSQTMAKGTLDMGNMNQMLQGGVPNALKILASSYGVTTGEMVKMISSGKVQSEDALPKLVKGIEEGTKATAALGGMMDQQSKTFSGSMANIGDTATQLVAGAFKPLFTLVSEGAGVFAKFLGSATLADWSKNTAKWLTDVIAAGKEMFGGLSGSVGGIKDIFQPLLDFGQQFAAGFKGAFSGSTADVGKNFLALLPAVSPVITIFKALAPQLPVLAELIGTLAGALGGALLSVLPTIAGLMTTLGGILGNVFAAAMPVVVKLVGTLVEAFQALMPGVTALLPVITNVAEMLGGFLGDALATLMPIVGQVADILGGILVERMGDVVGIVTELAPIIQAVAEQGFAILGEVLPVVADLLSTVVSALQPLAEALIGAAIPLVASLMPALSELASAVLPLIGEAVSTVMPFISDLVNILGAVLTGVINALMPVVKAVFEAIGPIISAAVGVITGIINVFSGLLTGNWDKVWKGLGQIVKGAWDLVVSIIRGAIGIVVAAVGAVVNAAVAIFQGIVALIGAVVAQLWRNVVNAIQLAVGAVSGAVKAIVDGAVNIFKGIVGFVTDIAGDAIDGLIGNFKKGAALAKAAFDLLVEKSVGVVKGMIGVLKGIGGDVVNGLVNGIKGAWHLVTEGIAALVRLIPEPVRKFLGIHSPSTLFAEIGGFVAQGMANGIDFGIPAAVGAAKRLGFAVVDAATGKNSPALTIAQRMERDSDSLAAAITRRGALAKQLATAQDALKSALDARVSDAKSGSDSFLASGSVTGAKGAETPGADGASGTTAPVNSGDILQHMREALSAGKQAQGVLTQLRKSGLNATSMADAVKAYQSNGDLTFAQAIVAGGKDAIAEMNALQGRLSRQASVLGDTESAAMNDAGIKAAKAHVKALKGKDGDAEDAVRSHALRLQAALDAHPEFEKSLGKKGADAVAAMNKALKNKGGDIDDAVSTVADLVGAAVAKHQPKSRKAMGDSGSDHIKALTGAHRAGTTDVGLSVAEIHNQVANIATVARVPSKKALSDSGNEHITAITTAHRSRLPDVDESVHDVHRSVSAATGKHKAESKASMSDSGKEVTGSMVDALKSRGGDIDGSLGNVSEQIRKSLNTRVPGVRNDMKAVGVNLVRGIADGMDDGGAIAAIDAVINKLADHVVAKSKAALKIHSPSALMRDEIGLNIGLGVAAGIDASKIHVSRSMENLADPSAFALPSSAWARSRGAGGDFGSSSGDTHNHYDIRLEVPAKADRDDVEFSENLLSRVRFAVTSMQGT